MHEFGHASLPDRPRESTDRKRATTDVGQGFAGRRPPLLGSSFTQTLIEAIKPELSRSEPERRAPRVWVEAHQLAVVLDGLLVQTALPHGA